LAAVLPISRALAAPVPPVVAFDLGRTTFTVLNAKGTQVIGRSEYNVTIGAGGLITERGEARFKTGEYDVEYATLQSRGPHLAPEMLTLEHHFYNPDGTPQLSESADFRTDYASCTQYRKGVANTEQATLEFSPNSYGGSAVIIPLQEYLAHGGIGPLNLTVLNCIPSPKLIKVTASPHVAAVWSHYPGQTVEMDVTPDLGWVNIIIGAFLPRLRAWFDPSEHWRFVGGVSSRYYRGPQIMLVRDITSRSDGARLQAQPAGASPKRDP